MMMMTVDAAHAITRPWKALPGPRGLPLLGNLHQLDPLRLHTLLEGWAREFGPLYRLRLPPARAIVVADPETVLQVLRARPEGFRRMSTIAEVAREIGADGVFSAEGEAWRRQRRLVMSAFDPGHLRVFFPSMRRVAERLRHRWLIAAAEGSEVDPQADLMRFTVDVTASLAFGIDYNSLDGQGESLQKRVDGVFREINRRITLPVPYWRWLPLPGDRRFARELAHLQRQIAGFIGEARRRLDADPALREAPRNLIEALIVTRDTQPDQFTDADISGNVLTMLLAGEDTTAHTAVWLIHLLAGAPAQWNRLVEEVRAVIGDEARVPQSIEQLARMPFLDACVHEALRLRPAAPVIALETCAEQTLEGVRLAKGTRVFLLTRRHATVGGEAGGSARFEPERWPEASGRLQARRYEVPFGAGPRVCPGRQLAMLEIKTMICLLAAGFERPQVRALGSEEPREVFRFTMAPSPMRMRLRVHGQLPRGLAPVTSAPPETARRSAARSAPADP